MSSSIPSHPRLEPVREPVLIPEFAVSDWQASRIFYCDILGFETDYFRPEDGFAMLSFGAAKLMIDQIGEGRTFGDGHLPLTPPFGRGLNLQIRTRNVGAMIARLQQAELPLYLPLEEKWYRKGDQEVGHRQFVIADPDGYLLRFFEDLGSRDFPG